MSGTPYLIVGGNAASGGSTTLTLTAGANVTAGDSIIVGVLVSTASVTVTVADSQNNSYTQILSDTTEAAAQQYVFEADGVNPMVSGTDTFTITYSANTSVQGAIVVGDNNVIGSFAGTCKIAHGSSTAPSSGSSGTLNQGETHAIAFIVDAAGGGVPTWASPWSSNVLANEEGGTTSRISAAYQDVTINSALTASGTITSAVWSCSIVTMNVTAPSLGITLSDGVENEAYSQTLSGAGGNGSYTYSITVGSLPTGLSLSAGVISGTPTASGSFPITIQVEDGIGFAATSAQTITILPSGASGVAVQTLEGQRLSLADQDFESGIGTWAAETNASSLAQTSEISLTGDYSLRWKATAAGATEIHTGYYTVTPNKPYVVSGFIMPCGQRDTNIGIEWYTSGNSLIAQDLGADNPSSTIAWQPVTFAGTAPSNAAKCKVVYVVQEANAGDVTHIDTTYLAQSGAQVLVDWSSSPFPAGSQAGQNFMDCTPWVRMDQGISIARGRQDNISEIQAGSCSFQLQNDAGTFTRYRSDSLVVALGGDATLQRRVQINLTDETGAWWTRFDGPIADIDYTLDDTGNTNIALVTGTDILAELNRQDALSCWTKELVLSDGPLYHWTLDDAGNAGGAGVAAESSGNNGPPMRLLNSDSTLAATIAWQDTSGGVETLADSVAPSQPDGSEYWNPGTSFPNSQLRGLDAGTVGPYTTPLASVLLTPKLTSEGSFNYWVGNTGYQFQTVLPTVINPTASSYSFEIWFTLSPNIIADVADNYGPYTLFSLGNSRTGLTFSLAIEPASGHLTFQGQLWAQPPGFVGKNFSASAPLTEISQVSSEISGDKVPLPHHAVVTISQDPIQPVLIAYLDGALFSDEFTSMDLNAACAFDTITAGGVFGGTGAYSGNIQLLSVYDYLMSGQQVINHAQMGQYGMWEETTDDCIVQLGVFANIPSFWNNLTSGRLGLTITEYQDITGSNALTSMQLYEQAEMGLLFVDALGRLNFHTRDWRQGHPAPDLYLPPDTFDASMGYQTIDQFQINEQAVATQIFQTGASYINTDSQDEYGTYATAGVGSPIQLPLITWSRAYAQLGLASYFYWADPYLEDYCAWIANSRAEPWLIPGQLTIDLLTLSKTSTGVGISDIYGLEIDSMVAPSGTLPASFPNVNLSTEWFIEGINEIYSTSQRTWQAYTSPGEPQRAWKPGDTTYGALGSTTRIGVSAPDTNTPVADGKDVSHDAGGPYWAPQFTSTEALNSVDVFYSGDDTGWSAYLGTLAVDNGTLYPNGPRAYSLVGTGTGGDEVSVEAPSAAVAANDTLSVGAWIYSPAGDTVQVGVDMLNSSHVYVSTTLGTGVTVAANVWTYVTAADIAVPGSGVAYAYPRANSGTTNAIMVVQDLRMVRGMLPPDDMNSPVGNGSGFVGAVDIRGLTTNLQTALNPPMLVAGITNGKTQTQASGSLSAPQVYWDNIFVDTTGGMGAVPGWPNWYVVTVPGFYDIDATLVWNGIAGGAQAAQAFLIVAMGAAQGVAAGTSGPTTVDQYVCPIGEQQFLNGHDHSVINAPSTRMYLGVGDMIAVGAEQASGSSVATSASFGGSRLSLLWRGYANYDDRQQINASITGGAITGGGGGGAGPPPAKTTYTKTYNSVATYAYYGAAIDYQRKNTNGSAYQGTYSGGEYVTGSEVSLILMPWSTIQSDLSGATVESITLKCTNQHTWYDSGGSLILGWSERTGGGATCQLTKGTDFANLQRIAFGEGATKTFSLPVSTWGGALASHLGCFLIGDQSTTNLDYYGYWKGGKNSWVLTVKYKK